MQKITKIVSSMLAVAVVLAISVVLAGCASNSANDELGKAKANIVGDWKVTAIDDGTGQMDGYIELLDSMNITMVFTFNADGSATLVAGEDKESTPATWEMKDPKTITLSLDSSSADATVDGNTINVTQSDGGTMTLEKQVK